MTTDPREMWMRQAIALAVDNVRSGRGGPFGVVVVRNGSVIAMGANRVAASNDPTAHAEIVAIRAACHALEHFQLEDCEIYSSCEPCPMCMGALYWARPAALYYAATRLDAARAGFDDEWIYTQLSLAPEDRTMVGRRLLAAEAFAPFEEWVRAANRVTY